MSRKTVTLVAQPSAIKVTSAADRADRIREHAVLLDALLGAMAADRDSDYVSDGERLEVAHRHLARILEESFWLRRNGGVFAGVPAPDDDGC